MMKIVLATHNHNKLREFREIFSSALSGETKEPLEIISLTDIGFFDEIEETGTTFEENALIKARAAASLGYITISDDSGLEVDALHGEPGIYSARYGGDKCADDKERYEYLLKNMENVPEGKRSARFVSVITCTFPDGREVVARGEIEGEILRAPIGEGGFGYDPIFFVPSEGMTTAEMSAERKNEISHRARSLQIMSKKLKEIL